MDSTPVYTIDLDALANLFRKAHKYYRGRFIKLWENIEQLFSEGKLISHAEVLREINSNNGKEDELQIWANAHELYFLPDYRPEEQAVIAEISLISEQFLTNKTKSQHADPWIIAQARSRNLILVTEEVKNNSQVKPQNYSIPDVCSKLSPAVRSISLRELIDEEDWIF